MSKKISIEFVISGKTQTTVHLASLPALEPKNRRGRKKKLVIDNEDNDVSADESDKRQASIDTDSVRSAPKSNTKKETKKAGKGRPGRKKKNQEEEEEEEENEFPAPKVKPNRSRGGQKSQPKKGGRGKKVVESPKDEDSAASSVKNADESMSGIDENLDIDEDDMKLEDDDEDPMMEEDDEDDDDFEGGGLSTLSTKNILRLTKMQQDDSAASDKNSVTDISSLNIDVSKLTRRQKTQLKNQAGLDVEIDEPLLQLPDKKSRKKKDMEGTEEDEAKKMETANKRRMLNQKLQEEQKKKTINKILNEAGRKQKMRKEKEEKNEKDKATHQYRTLPDDEVGIKYINNAKGTYLVVPEGFDPKTLLVPLF